MRHRKAVLPLIAALMTLVGGLVNLESVIGPSLPDRYHILRRLVPIAFLNASRFMTMLVGFALVVSALNIYKRKKRALALASILSVLSIVLHLVKGLDYEEALASVLLLSILYAARKSFTVKSGTPDWSATAIRLGLSAAVAAGYAVAGFWLLDAREFGVDFTWRNAMHQAILVLSLVADPTVTPHTRYAFWFIDSMYVLEVAAFAYAAAVLFRPALYRFHTHPHQCAAAAEIIQAHGRTSLDYFKVWPDKSFFFSETGRSFLAYRVAGGFAVVLGDPVGPEEEMEGIIAAFDRFCRDQDWTLAFHQTTPHLLPVYARLGYRRIKVGDEAIVDLEAFRLEGRKAKAFRSKVQQLDAAGYRTVRYEPPCPEKVLRELQAVSDEWLSLPGRRERGFTLGRFQPDYVRGTPVLVVEDPAGRILAFANLIPSFAPGEAQVDLMRRRTDGPNGMMDYLFVKLMLDLKARGFQRFNFGMAPMAGFREGEIATTRERLIHATFQHMGFLFSYQGLRAYKAKFATSWESRYVVYRGSLDLARFALALGRITDGKDTPHVLPLTGLRFLPVSQPASQHA